MHTEILEERKFLKKHRQLYMEFFNLKCSVKPHTLNIHPDGYTVISYDNHLMLATFDQYEQWKKYVEEKQVKCCICGDIGDKHNEWGLGAWDEGRTEIVMARGTFYPENSFGERCKINLCPVCFKEKLIPFLESEGAKIKMIDWNDEEYYND